MKNIRIYRAPRYSSAEFTLAEEGIWRRRGKDQPGGILESVANQALTAELLARGDWGPAPEPWTDSHYSLELEGKRYFREIPTDEDSLDTIFIEQEEITYVTSLIFEQEPELGENAPEDAEVSQYPLEDLLDQFYCWVSYYYAEENEVDPVNSYLEFASNDIEDIRGLITIVGKHVYNREDGGVVRLVVSTD